MNEIHLTNEQEHVLQEQQGFVQGSSFVLMRIDVFRDLLGLESDEELRERLQIAFDQADCGEVAEWNAEEFLQRMHQQHQSGPN